MEDHPADRGGKHPLMRMFLLAAIASAIGIAAGLAIDWFPTNATSSTHQIDTLWDVLIIVSVPIFVLVMTVAIYSVIRFRARPGDKSDGAPIHGNARLEVVWVLVPFIIVSVLAGYAWWVLNDIEKPQPNEMRVNAIGQQFAWSFTYPQAGNFTSKELVLPVNRPVYFYVSTKDVIHSFWVPGFRLKYDAVPGITTKLHVTPDRIGRYEVICAELCGLGHATMRQTVRVVSPQDFDTWKARTQSAAKGTASASGAGTISPNSDSLASAGGGGNTR
jgi:cytochrome c oxidase subunit 2